MPAKSQAQSQHTAVARRQADLSLPPAARKQPLAMLGSRERGRGRPWPQNPEERGRGPAFPRRHCAVSLSGGAYRRAVQIRATSFRRAGQTGLLLRALAAL
jgi:hypothetical protein